MHRTFIFLFQIKLKDLKKEKKTKNEINPDNFAEKQ